VKDVISGFFLLFEGLIAVGDVISFGNSAGVVEEVGLRVTKYRTFTGELWVIPNGEIRAFGNSNRQWMRAVVVVGVAYEQISAKPCTSSTRLAKPGRRAPGYRAGTTAGAGYSVVRRVFDHVAASH
jgi:hypothetical protein